MKNLRLLVLTITSLALVLLGCENMGTPPGTVVPDGKISTTLNFNLTGAKAIGSADIAASKALKGVGNFAAARAILSRQSADEFGLVKVLEDGTVELAMELPEGAWMPKIMFIATNPSGTRKDLYVAFEGSISYWDETTKTQVNIGSFLHILEDGSSFSIIDKTNGRVKDYSWGGNDNYKPVSFDANGAIYYAFTSWGSSMGSDQLFKYDPVTMTNTAITPQLSGVSINNFEVSADGTRLFVQGYKSSGSTSTNYFRMYPVNDVENPKTVYYTSNSNTWVRGYKVSPANVANQNVILNGYNIRGINGLLRANVAADNTITYEPLFDSSTSWFTVDFNEWYSEWEDKTYVNGYFSRFDSYNTYAVLTDGTDEYYLDMNNFKWMQQYNKYGTELFSVSVIKQPLKTDWMERQQTNIGLAPIASLTNKFGFASKVDGTMIPAVGKTVEADVTDSTFTFKSYYDGLSNADRANIKLVYVRDTWTNGTSTRTLEDVPSEVLPLFAPTDPAVTAVSTVYVVNDYWLNNDGSPKTSEFLAYAGKYFLDEVLFKYGANAAGADSIAAFFAKKVYTDTDLRGVGNTVSSEYFLNTYFVKADGTAATTFKKFKEDNNLTWLNFQNVSALHYDESGACWAIIGGNNWGGTVARPVKILKPDGTKTLEHIPSLNTGTYNPVSYMVSGNKMFFRDGLLDSDGFETGYHKLYMIDLSNTSLAPVDMLSNVAENGKLEIVSFSVSANEVYFTGVKGTGVIGGKIDISTKAYTPLDDNYLLRDIEIY